MGVDPPIVESLNIVNRVSQSISLFTMHGFGKIHEFVEGRIRIEDAHIVAEVRLKFRTVTRPVVLALTDGLQAYSKTIVHWPGIVVGFQFL